MVIWMMSWQQSKKHKFMTGHILTGNEKDLDRVIRENRVRVNRGLIKFIPVSESGMITMEEARKAVEEELSKLNASVKENVEKVAILTKENDDLKSRVSKLEATLNEKDALVASLTTECEGLLARAMELEAIAEDKKELPVSDSKDLTTEDSKGLVTSDDKTVNVEEKKRGRPVTRKTE